MHLSKPEKLEKQRDNLRKELQEIVKRSKESGEHDTLSLRKIADIINIGRSTLNQWLNNKYSGNNTKIDKAVNQFIQRFYTKQEFGDRINFVETENAKKIYEICKWCQVTGDIGYLSGKWGVGKTMGLKEYAKEYSGAIIIELDQSYTTKILLKEIAVRLGIILNHSNTHDYQVAIEDELRQTSRLIIVDEIEHLTINTINHLRRIHDKTGVGVVISGLPSFFAELKSKQRDYGYIYSRVGISSKLYPLGKLDVRKIVNNNLPNADWMVFYDQLPKEYIKKNGKRMPRVNGRVLGKLIKSAHRLSKINGRGIDKKLVNEAYKLLEV